MLKNEWRFWSPGGPALSDRCIKQASKDSIIFTQIDGDGGSQRVLKAERGFINLKNRR